jgi:hypothetical protein
MACQKRIRKMAKKFKLIETYSVHVETEFSSHLSTVGLREAVNRGVDEFRVLGVEQFHELDEISGDALDVSAQLVQVVDIRVASANRVVNEHQIHVVHLIKIWDY